LYFLYIDINDFHFHLQLAFDAQLLFTEKEAKLTKLQFEQNAQRDYNPSIGPMWQSK